MLMLWKAHLSITAFVGFIIPFCQSMFVIPCLIFHVSQTAVLYLSSVTFILDKNLLTNYPSIFP